MLEIVEGGVAIPYENCKRACKCVARKWEMLCPALKRTIHGHLYALVFKQFSIVETPYTLMHYACHSNCGKLASHGHPPILYPD